MTGPVGLVHDGGIAYITIDNPPVNAASHAVRAGLMQALAGLDGAELAVLLAAGRTFVAGADIREFSAPPRAPLLPDVVLALHRSDVPIVAILHGTTLGGGLELALACRARIALPGTRLGLPEVSLGIIPGAGGTQLLPRLVGLGPALEMITTGRPIAAEAALEIGLIDAISDATDPIRAARAAAERLRAEGLPARTNDPLTGADAEDPAFEAARDRLARSARGQIAPQKAVEAVRHALTDPLDDGMAAERRLFGICRDSPQRGALVHLFFAERAATKPPAGVAPRAVARVGIVGAGTMGTGIARACLAAGLPVRLIETDADVLARSVRRIEEALARDTGRGQLGAAAADRQRAALLPDHALDALGDTDLVIEAVFETLEAKQAVFRTLDRVVPEGAVLASNTSALDIDEIAGATGRGRDVLGLHFFSPAHVMALVEVVRGTATSDAALATAMAVARRIGKVPVPVGNLPGFVGNRLLFHYGREAESLLEEGAEPAQVDRVLTAFGMAMGVFAVRDLSGNDVGLAIRRNWRGLYPDHPFPEIIDAMVAAGRVGQKAGQGFYDYRDGDRTPRPSAEVATIVAGVSTRRGIDRRRIDDAEIRDRCILALVNEGARLIGDQVVRSAGDIDVIYRHGYGFPAWRGGPMYHADTLGLPQVLDRVRAFHDRYGPWWKPAPLLETLAREGGRFTG